MDMSLGLIFLVLLLGVAGSIPLVLLGLVGLGIIWVMRKANPDEMDRILGPKDRHINVDGDHDWRNEL